MKSSTTILNIVLYLEICHTAGVKGIVNTLIIYFNNIYYILYLNIYILRGQILDDKASNSDSVSMNNPVFFFFPTWDRTGWSTLQQRSAFSLVRKLKLLNTVNRPLFAWGICIDIQHYRSPSPLSEQMKWSGPFALAEVKAISMSKMTWEWKDKCLISARTKSTITISMFNNSKSHLATSL